MVPQLHYVILGLYFFVFVSERLFNSGVHKQLTED